MTLENLSLGGLSLTGGPAAWQRHWPVAVTLEHGGVRLFFVGQVVWRRGDTVGIAFAERGADLDRRVEDFLAVLLPASRRWGWRG